MNQHVVLMGNVLNGFTAIGPFPSYVEASARARVENTAFDPGNGVFAVSARIEEIRETDCRETWLIVEGSIAGGFKVKRPVSGETAEALANRRECDLLQMERPQ